jgi:hypothetical protein
MGTAVAVGLAVTLTSLHLRNSSTDEDIGTAAPSSVTAKPSPAETRAATTSRRARTTALAASVQAPLGGPFSSASAWRTDITRAPVAKNSATLVSTLTSQVSAYYGGVAAFNVWDHNTSFYKVGASQDRVDVIWDDCQGKGYVPAGLYGREGHFTDVPIPATAVPAAGSDGSLTIYQPSTDTMWDLWKAKKKADGWHACWGGRMDDVSSSPGYFPPPFGTAATGLSLIGGAIGIKEAQAGRIDHALTLQIPRAAVHTVFSWPAQRSDGTDRTTAAIPEGTRFRLDPSVDVEALPLHPLARMVAKAAQTYGFIVTDRAGCVSVVTESGAPTAALTGVNPWKALMAGTPGYAVMKNFPWSRLEALPTDYGKP